MATTPRTYKVDRAHSEATFQIRYLLTKVRGRFTDFDGTIEFDKETPAKSLVSFSIRAASIDTNEPDRDKHLRSGDFFAVDQFPNITFTSSRISKKNDDQYEVIGNLTMHGITKEIALPVTYLGVGNDPWGNERIGFEAEHILNRKEFALTYNTVLETGGLLIGDDAKVSLSVQAVAQ